MDWVLSARRIDPKEAINEGLLARVANVVGAGADAERRALDVELESFVKQLSKRTKSVLLATKRQVHDLRMG